MSCLNISFYRKHPKFGPRFKQLEKVFGTELAKVYTIAYTDVNQNKISGGLDYYVPSMTELNSFIGQSKEVKAAAVKEALTENPSLTIEGILPLLRTVIHRFNNQIFLTVGEGNKEGLTLIEAQNKAVLTSINKKFPGTFTTNGRQVTYRNPNQVRAAYIESLQREGLDAMGDSIGITSSSDIFYQLPPGQHQKQIDLQAEQEVVLEEFANSLSERFNISFDLVSEEEAKSISPKYTNEPAFFDPKTKKAYLVKGKANKTSAIHEIFTHPFLLQIEKTNPTLYKNLLKEAKNNKSVVDYVDNLYGTKQNNDHEYIARAIDLAVQGELDQQKDKTLLGRIQDFFNQLSDYLKKLFNIPEVFSSAISPNITLQQLTQFAMYGKGKMNLNPAQENIEYSLKATNVLIKNLDTIKQWEKNKSISEDVLWNKIQGLGIPKEQIELIKNSDGSTVEEKLLDFTNRMSFTVEINTAEEKLQSPSDIYNFNLNGDNYSMSYYQGIEEDYTDYLKNGKEISYEEYNKAQNEYLKIFQETVPTQHYSNLTVPGGTAYTENAHVIPAMKGKVLPDIYPHHDQEFANGDLNMYGWDRSDDLAQESGVENRGYWNPYTEEVEYDDEMWAKGSTKTRRILEIQSKFQKWRLNFEHKGNKYQLLENQTTDKPNVFEDHYLENGKRITGKEYNKIFKEFLDTPTSQEDAFIKLIAKQWETLMIRSIIQDSAKKGYSKVWLPIGNTASRIEGHTTLEEFKKQKEDRIKELETSSILKNKTVDGFYYIQRYLEDENGDEVLTWRKVSNETGREKTATVEEIAQLKERFSDETKNEINQLKQELERIETEGFGALKPIWNFYENTVTNILINDVYGKESEFVNYEFTFNNDKYERLNDENKYLKNGKEITQKEFNRVQSSVTKQDKKEGKFIDKYYVNSNALITDEHGNTWNEVTIDENRDNQNIVFQKVPEYNSFQQFQQSLNKPNTNPVLQGNQQEQVKKFAELQERLSNKEFLEGAKNTFESSEELQNAAYEALGFDIDATITTKKQFNPDIPEATTYALRINNKYAGLIAVDNDGTINSSIGQTGVELEPEFQGKGYGKKIYLKVAQELAKEGKTLKSELFGKDNINKSATRVWESLARDGYAIDKGKYYEIINTTTPQQKQEALNAYTDYIARVSLGIIKNPTSGEYNYESQVRDVLYHGTKDDIDSFKKVGITSKGIHFHDFKEFWTSFTSITKIGKNIPVILNITNPERSKYPDMLSEEEIQLYKNQQIDGIVGDSSYLEDIVIKEQRNIEGKEYVVFEPEQIHVLSSKADIEGFKEFVGSNQSKILLQSQTKPDSIITVKTLEGETIETTANSLISYPTEFGELNYIKNISGDLVMVKSVTDSLQPVAATKSAIEFFKKVLDRAGVTFHEITDPTSDVVLRRYFPDNSTKVNGFINLTNKIVGVLQDKIDVALPEEALHLGVAIIKKNDPKLYQELFNKIGTSAIYRSLQSDPIYTKRYRTEDGRLDIKALKEEAIGKLLANMFTEELNSTESIQTQQETISWWNKVLQWFKSLLQKAGLTPKEYEDAYKKAIRVLSDEGYWSQEADSSIETLPQFNTLKTKANDVVKTEEGYTVNNELYKEAIPPTSYHDKRDLLFTNMGRTDIVSIMSRFIDENGYLRAQPLPKTGKPAIVDLMGEAYENIEEVVKKLLHKYPEGTKFIYNIPIYDSSSKRATTLDFLAITPEEVVDIRSWNFLVTKDRRHGEPKYKVLLDIQKNVGTIKQILRKEYNLQKFGTVRGVPFNINFQYSGNNSASIRNVEIPTDEALQEIPLSNERTGEETIDRLLDKLNAVLKQVNNLNIDYAVKTFQLNTIFKAITGLQVKRGVTHTINAGTSYLGLATGLIAKLKTLLDNPTNLTLQEVNKLSVDIHNTIDLLEPYLDLDIQLKDLELPEEQKTELRNLANATRFIKEDATAVFKTFVEKYVAEANSVEDLLAPEKPVNTIGRNFLTLSQQPTRAAQTFYKITQQTKNEIDFQHQEAIQRLKELQTSVVAWANTNGVKKTDIINQFRKNPSTNELVDEYEPEFYKELKARTGKEDDTWIRENIDALKFREYVKEYARVKRESIMDLPSETPEQQGIKRTLMEDLNRSTDLTRPETWRNYYFLRRFPTDKWKTEAYKKIESTPQLFELYQYIKQWNARALNANYLTQDKSRTFLPFIRKTFAEKLLMGGNYNPVTNILETFTTDSATVGYGQFNPVTGQLEDTIPIYFVTDFTKEGLGGDLSNDIFKNLALYIGAVINYEQKKEIEGIARALYFVEKNKQSLQTDKAGNIVRTHGQVELVQGNQTNADLFNNYLKTTLYGQRFTTSVGADSSATNIMNTYNKFAAKVKTSLGIPLPSISGNIEKQSFSGVRALDFANKLFQLTTLGINFGSSISQFFGGNFQGIVQSGRYYTGKEFLKAEWGVITHKILKNDENVHYALIKNFLPLVDQELDLRTKELALSALNRRSFSDLVMIMMRKSDHLVQYTNFLAMMDNAIVVDGKVYNARTYYRNSKEYQERYSNPVNLKNLEAEFENKVQELKDSHGIAKFIKLEKGKPVLEGVDKQSIYAYRSLILQTTKTLTGNITSEDEIGIRMNVIGRSFMVFKNWMVRPLSVRFAPLEYRAATDQYEWGRYRTLGKFLLNGAWLGLNKMYNIAVANEKGLTSLSELFQKESEAFKLRTNKDLNLSEAEFYDLVRENLSSAFKDTLFFLTLISITIAASLAYDDEDEYIDEESRNYWRYSLRTLDKITDEVSFYYNPIALQQILSGGIFPSLGVITNAITATSAIAQEGFGYAIGDEALIEKTKPMKYMMKNFPISNQLLTYLAVFTPELAKEMGIQISEKSRLR